MRLYCLYHVRLAACLEPCHKYDLNQQQQDEDLALEEKGNDENCNEMYENHDYEKNDSGENSYRQCDGRCHDGRCHVHRTVVKTNSDLGHKSNSQPISYNTTVRGNSWPNLVVKCQERSCAYLPEGRIRCGSDTTLKDSSPRKQW